MSVVLDSNQPCSRIIAPKFATVLKRRVVSNQVIFRVVKDIIQSLIYLRPIGIKMYVSKRLALRQGLHSLKEAWQLSGTNKLNVGLEGLEPPISRARI